MSSAFLMDYLSISTNSIFHSLDSHHPLNIPGSEILETPSRPLSYPDHRQHPCSRPQTPPLTRQALPKVRAHNVAETGQHDSRGRILARSRQNHSLRARRSLLQQKYADRHPNRTPRPVLHGVAPRRHPVAQASKSMQGTDVLGVPAQRQPGHEEGEAGQALRACESLPRFRPSRGRRGNATSLNLISATLFSLELATFGEGSSSQDIKEVVRGVMRCLGSPNLADYFPILRRADPQGILKETRYYFGRLFEIFDGIVDDRLKSRAENRTRRDDVLEALLDLRQKDELSRDDIKHLLLDLFAAGTDTTSSTVEWAMAELLENDNQIQESEVQRLPYLQAVVKETFRLHPPAPFLIPHKADADVEIKGHIVPKEAQILVNVWALGRDFSVWPEVDKFKPERFMGDGDSHFHGIEFRGQDFELIPFGAGSKDLSGLAVGG